MTLTRLVLVAGGAALLLTGCGNLPTITINPPSESSSTATAAPAPSTAAPQPVSPAWVTQVRAQTTAYAGYTDAQIVGAGQVWCALVQSNLATYPDEDTAIVAAFNTYGYDAQTRLGAGAAGDAGILAGAATVATCPQYLAAINRVRAAHGA